MPQNISSLSLPKLNIFFQSQRASVDGQSNAHLVQFIKSAKKTLDCAIYDFKQQDVLDALKSMSKKVKLRIAYDGGKKKAVTGGAKADPKPPGTEDALRKSGLHRDLHGRRTSDALEVHRPRRQFGVDGFGQLDARRARVARQ